jgi:hypothetical protein
MRKRGAYVEDAPMTVWLFGDAVDGLESTRDIVPDTANRLLRFLAQSVEPAIRYNTAVGCRPAETAFCLNEKYAC